TLVVLGDGADLLISLIGYFNSSRYRLSLAPIIVLFAAVALVQIWERYRHRPGLWRVLGTVVVVAVILNWPIDHFTKRFNFEAETEALAGAQLLNEGRQPESLAAHKRSIELDPESYYAHYLYGKTLDKLNRPAESAAELNEALRIDPLFYP